MPDKELRPVPQVWLIPDALLLMKEMATSLLNGKLQCLIPHQILDGLPLVLKCPLQLLGKQISNKNIVFF